MNDRELADKVVALGVGSLLPAKNKHGCHVRSYPWYAINDDEFCHGSTTKSAKNFVRDWRVAGALMEKMTPSDICKRIGADKWNVDDDYDWLQDPRAINEACVEKLHESL